MAEASLSMLLLLAPPNVDSVAVAACGCSDHLSSRVLIMLAADSSAVMQPGGGVCRGTGRRCGRPCSASVPPPPHRCRRLQGVAPAAAIGHGRSLIVMGVPSLPAASGVPLLAGGSVHSSSHVHGHTVDSSVHALGRG